MSLIIVLYLLSTYLCRLVWEQDVRVIIMLTRQVEGHHVKCGQYWNDGDYGVFKLRCRSSDGAEEKTTVNGFDFGNAKKLPGGQEIIRRVFHLTNMEDPEGATIQITHFQYLAWSDMDVPTDPDGLLRLIKEVDEITGQGLERARSPVLLHCSAGVGRTGGYIAVDAILDGIRRELVSLGSSRAESDHPSDEAMEIDDDDDDDADRAESVASMESIASPPPVSSAGGSSGGSGASSGGNDSANLLQQALLRKGLANRSPSASIVSNPAKRRRSHRDMKTRVNLTETSSSRFNGAGPSSILEHQLSTQPRSIPSIVQTLNPASPDPRRSVAPRSSVLNGPTSVSLSSSLPDNFDSGVATQATSLAPSRPPTKMMLKSSSSTFQSTTSNMSDPAHDHTAFDYTAPRQLHVGDAPVLRISTISNPIQAVLDDMREQRMSLVQSLRQYVFVHRAVLQGALDIADSAALSFAASKGDANHDGSSRATFSRGRNSLSKRPSVKRKQRSNDSDAPVSTLMTADMPTLKPLSPR